ncbi:WRKY transcription factor WRKY24 [Bienertia sinuspersici]
MAFSSDSSNLITHNSMTSFTDLLNSTTTTTTTTATATTTDDSNHFIGDRNSGIPKFKSLPPPSIPISQPSFSSYFALPPGLSPTDLLDSPVLLSSSNLLPSPTTGAFTAQPSNWKYNNSNIDNNNNSSNKQEDVNKCSDFTFQPQTRPNDFSSAIFQSSMTSFPTEQGFRGEQNQQQSWSFQNQNKQDDQSSNTTNAIVKSEFPNSQSESYKYEPDQNSSYQPAQYIKDQKKSDDGYNWRKYGQKQVKGSENPRSYYKCTFPNCPMKKKIEKSVEGQITEIVYKGSHNHPKPVNTRRSSSSAAAVASAFQNSVLSSNDFHDQSLVPQRSSSGQMDSVATPDNSSISVADDEVDMGSQRSRSSAGNEFDDDEPQAKRWRGEVENECMSAAPGSRAVKEPRVVVQTTSDIDILDDGYRWRKYGQKVVKGNPNPRSYYKCTSPGCPVRKHVERAAHDLRAVITTYEGKHNHDVPAARGSGMSRVAAPSNNGPMPLMAVRPSAVNYMSLNSANPNTYQSNQGMMASSFEGAGPLSPFTLQMLQNPGNFGFSGYMNQQSQYSGNMFSNNTITTTRAKEEPKDDTLFESLLC